MKRLLFVLVVLITAFGLLSCENPAGTESAGDGGVADATDGTDGGAADDGGEPIGGGDGGDSPEGWPMNADGSPKAVIGSDLPGSVPAAEQIYIDLDTAGVDRSGQSALSAWNEIEFDRGPLPDSFPGSFTAYAWTQEDGVFNEWVAIRWDVGDVDLHNTVYLDFSIIDADGNVFLSVENLDHIGGYSEGTTPEGSKFLSQWARRNGRYFFFTSLRDVDNNILPSDQVATVRIDNYTTHGYMPYLGVVPSTVTRAYPTVVPQQTATYTPDNGDVDPLGLLSIDVEVSETPFDKAKLFVFFVVLDNQYRPVYVNPAADTGVSIEANTPKTTQFELPMKLPSNGRYVLFDMF